jgi:DNA-directed RNA polymerase sigma subunit (sigma70/sigma32)
MKPTIEQTILVHQRVGKALSMLEARMADLGITEFLDELHDVRDDYDRMADSLSQGQRDPSGGKLYASLLKRTYRLYNNVRLSSIIRKYPVLKDREITIIRECFGIGCHEKGLEEIGDQLGLTRERVRQIREKSIAKLRDSGNAKILMKYLG